MDAAAVLVGRSMPRTALAVVYVCIFFFLHKGPKLNRDLEYYDTVQSRKMATVIHNPLKS